MGAIVPPDAAKRHARRSPNGRTCRSREAVAWSTEVQQMNAAAQTERRPDAVAWVDERHAIVAERGPAGRISTVEIRRLQQPEPRYLAHVVHELEDHDNVMIVGTQPLRLALERRFVAVTHRPECLIAPRWMAPATAATAATVESVATLAA